MYNTNKKTTTDNWINYIESYVNKREQVASEDYHCYDEGFDFSPYMDRYQESRDSDGMY